MSTADAAAGGLADDRKVKIDFIIPGSPNDAFFSQIAMYRLALDALGGIYRDARLVAVFGDSRIQPLPDKWKPYYERIDIEWADCADFDRMSYHATGLRCWEVYRPDADIVVSCDADTILMRPFPELVAAMLERPAFAGMVANKHIPWPNSSGGAAEDWRRISTALLGYELPLDYRYTLQPETACPYYLNAGFLVGTPAIFDRLRVEFDRLWPEVDRFMGTYFSSQVTICLASYTLDLPKLPLPRRFNYANDPETDKDTPDEAAAVIVLHYYSTEFFNRHRIFTTRERFDRFLSLRLEGCNNDFQDFIRRLTGGRYPFPGAEAEALPIEDAYDDLRTELGQLARYARSLEHHLRESQAYSLSLEKRIAELQAPPRSHQS